MPGGPGDRSQEAWSSPSGLDDGGLVEVYVNSSGGNQVA